MNNRNGCLFFFILLWLPLLLQAQNKNKIWVKYDVQFYSGMVGKVGILEANKSSSIFREGANSDDEDRISMSKDGNIVAIEKMDDTFTYINFDTQEVISKRTLKPTNYLVNEKLLPVKWKLIPGETKDISGLKSYKAEGEFRGRTYIAWYTPDIPLKMGPWKLHGLPGLILEVQDSEGKFRWTVTEIKYPYSGGIDISVPNNKNLIPISLKDYVILMEEHESMMRNKRVAQSPKGVRVVSSNTKRGVELIYEWEKE